MDKLKLGWGRKASSSESASRQDSNGSTSSRSGRKGSSRKDKKEKDKEKSERRSKSKSESSATGVAQALSTSSRTRNGDAAAKAAAKSGAKPNGPGAVSVGGGMATFRVPVPNNVRPGEEFQVFAGGRIVRVKCPRDSRPGQSLQITVPVDSVEGGDGAGGGGPGGGGGPKLPELPPDSENVTKIPNQELAPGEQPAYMVKIPENIRGGQQFPVTINGQQLTVTCPNMARPGMSVRIVPPPPPENGGATSLDRPRPPQRIANPNKQGDKTQMFEVVVPKGVKPGQPFALLAGGVRVLVTCPKNAMNGQKIRFNLPVGLVNRPDGPKSKLAEIKLSYDKDGWTRTIRATDMKFQWTRFDEKGNVDERTRFDTEKSAYVLKLDFLDDNDRMRQGRVSLVTPEKGVVDSKIKSANGNELVSYTDIATAQMKSYEDKIQWFQDTCAQLCVEWNEGHMRMNVRRDYLLSDSMEAVMSLTRKDLRKVWRFEFIGEAGIDAGGLAREWFELVTNEVFDPDMGLWSNSTTNQMCMQINPASEISCPEDHLIYFRFIGRVMGKAMFDRQLVKGHMVKHLYKHILGWPVMFSDLKDVDEEYYNSLKGLKDMGSDVEYVGVDFTVMEETLGVKQTVELVPGGADIDVVEDNLPEYIEACLKYRLLGRYEAQLNELLLGFFDVIPEPLLTIFDFQELELLMCGLPEIDMDNWMEHTEYSGEYDREGPNHEVCIWFWEIVREYDHEMRARLLQFVTGTSGVPAKGFSSLQGNDGNVRKFTIHGVTLDTCVYPRSHTCFNRIDLPLYEDREECEEKMKIAITMAATGFDIE
mmetsp:Transcript_7788/g.16923  ORF Transcript_7788/g.16923 Transcript_7788/m.16923 type:complete len:817 (-) Transcript_7788:317-2767(-)|eukprot:CAMPEP_0183733588 /NCGR_PEP_ID=MMETSP0737-20130205/41586_1 /TAXON_ID=385413 /ORGANISM="Thalassiosira miniscula, Strain CCMP1093" /LENGTH=816 /DNA_ID=CAMNT_0025966873 /DNA_START=250 /DNA_END=2700 /DNA_ORIENTATION=+